MKTAITKLATALVLSAVIAAPAAAAELCRADVQQSVNGAIGAGSNVYARLNNGVVTLTGRFDGYYDQSTAIAAVQRMDGVDRVINRAYITR